MFMHSNFYVSIVEGKCLFNFVYRIQANYVMWRAAASSVSYLTEAVRKRQLDYSTELSGRTEREPRWKECVDNAAGRYRCIG